MSSPTSKKPYDYLVVVGNFAPFHLDWEQVVQDALNNANHVIILVDNSHIPCNISNPWTYSERHESITASIRLSLGESSDRVTIKPLFNYLYDDNRWIAQVQQLVSDIIFTNPPTYHGIPIIGIYSNDKKLTDKFPQWDAVETTLISESEEATIRQMMFTSQSMEVLEFFFSSTMYGRMSKFLQSDEFKKLVKEFEFIKSYKEAWKAAPYAPTFCTSDAVVVQSGHILMIVRGGFPGNNQLALPGGFLEQNETFQEGAIRKLIEETKIDCPRKVLLGNIKDSRVFDAPNRSLRGRTVTQAFLIELPNGPLPKVKGSDDAKKAIWVPFDDLDSNNIFEDHFSIIRYWIK
jgi:bifunctional NMN adenylyltransferase/nudix hydrolase